MTTSFIGRLQPVLDGDAPRRSGARARGQDPWFWAAFAALLALACVGAIGAVSHALAWLLVVVFAGGFCIVGGQPAVNALAGHFYPTTLRSTDRKSGG